VPHLDPLADGGSSAKLSHSPAHKRFPAAPSFGASRPAPVHGIPFSASADLSCMLAGIFGHRRVHASGRPCAEPQHLRHNGSLHGLALRTLSGRGEGQIAQGL